MHTTESINLHSIRTRSDILQGQALFRGVKHLLTHKVILSWDTANERTLFRKHIKQKKERFREGESKWLNCRILPNLPMCWPEDKEKKWKKEKIDRWSKWKKTDKKEKRQTKRKEVIQKRRQTERSTKKKTADKKGRQTHKKKKNRQTVEGDHKVLFWPYLSFETKKSFLVGGWKVTLV